MPPTPNTESMNPATNPSFSTPMPSTAASDKTTETSVNVNEPQISGILTYMYISGQYVHMYVQCVCVCAHIIAQGVFQKSDAPASSSSESSESGKYR